MSSAHVLLPCGARGMSTVPAQSSSGSITHTAFGCSRHNTSGATNLSRRRREQLPCVQLPFWCAINTLIRATRVLHSQITLAGVVFATCCPLARTGARSSEAVMHAISAPGPSPKPFGLRCTTSILGHPDAHHEQTPSHDLHMWPGTDLLVLVFVLALLLRGCPAHSQARCQKERRLYSPCATSRVLPKCTASTYHWQPPSSRLRPSQFWDAPRCHPPTPGDMYRRDSSAHRLGATSSLVLFTRAHEVMPAHIDTSFLFIPVGLTAVVRCLDYRSHGPDDGSPD